MRILLLLALLAGCPAIAAAGENPCRITEPLKLRVRFAGEAPRDVLVESAPSGIRLRDAGTGAEIWSAGSGSGHTQSFPGMNANFGTSFAAVQMDADGVHDRIYAGDRAGRLWRLDLHAGATPSAWMHAAVIAELGVPGGGRSFVARPDIARIESPAGKSWLNIAIGTANTGAPRNDHRLYVLRDSITEPPAPPLAESDLEPLSPPAGTTRGNAHGYYLPLGTAQVLAQPLTLNGRIHFTAVESTRNQLDACGSIAMPAAPVPVSITVLDATNGAVPASRAEIGMERDLHRILDDAFPPYAAVTLTAAPSSADGRLQCVIGATPLPGCFLDTSPTRSWWRREDAD